MFMENLNLGFFTFDQFLKSIKADRQLNVLLFALFSFLYLHKGYR